MGKRNNKMELNDMVGSIDENTFEYKAGLGGDTGRGELPNIPAPVEVQQDYKGMMQPVSQRYSQDDLDGYASKMLGLPIGAPPIHQLSLLAGRVGDEGVGSDKGKQVGASLLRRQMNSSRDTGWMTEPLITDYIRSIGLDSGRADRWDTQLKDLYGI